MPLPVIPSATFNVTDYKAVGDNKTNDTTFIQTALTAASGAGGGTVLITISTLTVSGQAPPKNTDGVDMNATGAFFCNNNIACGDDNIVMAGSNVYVAYSTFGVGHGCSIGSITSNGVSNVTVDSHDGQHDDQIFA